MVHKFHACGATIKISASTASTNMALDSDGAAPQVMVSNFSVGWAHVVFGGSTVTSTFPTTANAAAGYIVAPNSQLIVTPGTDTTYMGVSLSSGTGIVYATPGLGD